MNDISVNQIWSDNDSRDGYPRRLVRVVKVGKETVWIQRVNEQHQPNGLTRETMRSRFGKMGRIGFTRVKVTL